MNKKMIRKIFSALIRLIAITIYQPLVNIIISWKNILSGKNTSNLDNKVQITSSKDDYLNLLQDWERIGQDFWRLFKW